MALDTMGLTGGTDVLREISMRLEESHLAYLQLDESPLKLQARQKLEGFIKEYLCHVPNERKYVFQETADILHRSAATVKDFSGYRACTAWRALSLYAANLLAQPWRKEYRTLRTYSGYYKHEIEANLIGAELMFELMGYKHTGLGVLTLEGPIDPDRVSNVSRDAIVAFVECQILKEIWESVSQKFTVSWLEVLEFRCNSVGTAEQAIRALNFRFLERLHQSREKTTTSNSYRDYAHPSGGLVTETPIASLIPTTIPYHAISSNYNAAILPNTCKPDSVYPSEVNFYFAPMDGGNLVNRCANPYVCRPPIGHYYPMAHSTMGNSMTMSVVPGHATRVPTGRLIELDPPLPASSNYDRNRQVLNEISNKTTKSRSAHEDPQTDDVDFRRTTTSSGHGGGGGTSTSSSSGTCLDRHDYARVDKRSIGKLSRNNLDARDNDWEFVYKNLASRGYSKDLGERDDVLSRKKELLLEAQNSSRFQQQQQKNPPRSLLVNVADHDERHDKYGSRGSRDDKKRLPTSIAGKGVNFNDGHLDTIVNGHDNRNREAIETRKKTFLEPHDPLPTPVAEKNDKTFGIFDKNDKKYSNTLPTSRTIYKSSRNDNSGAMRKTESTRDSKKHDVKQSLAAADRWNCATCTFLNYHEREICEMCGKSRRKGNEDKPLASGGKECPQCTLVNDKNASDCEACTASLKDSPTYI